MPIRVAVIGTGRMGAFFARQIANRRPKVELAAVVDIEPQRAEAVGAALGVSKRFHSASAFFADPGADAVVIATPTDTHARLVQQAARAGLDVFCEKPLALSIEECQAAVAAVESAGVMLQVGFMRRFDPAYAAAKEKIAAGRIGLPVLFRATSRDPQPPAPEYANPAKSGGLIMDMGVHDFDLARWLMGSEVIEVFASGACLLSPALANLGDLDNAVVSLKFANGGVGSVDLSRNAVYGYDIRTEILGAGGALFVGQEIFGGRSELSGTRQPESPVPFFLERFSTAYAAELQAFLHCVQRHSPPAVTGRDGLAATSIALAARESLRKRLPVPVSIAAPG